MAIAAISASLFVGAFAPLGAALAAGGAAAPTIATTPLPADGPGPAPVPEGTVADFATLLLGALGAPVSATNVGAIVAWAAGEGSCAANNPLDTTEPEPGATPFNTLSGGTHVWNYPSAAIGVEATAATLGNGLYGPILAALRADAGVAAVERAVRSTPWGTGAFGSPNWPGPTCGPR